MSLLSLLLLSGVICMCRASLIFLTHNSFLRIPFPHLVLLCSGGHCILAIAEHVHKFTVLGTCLDDSPGMVLDKCARTMQLDRHPDGAGVPGGVAIEKIAKKGKFENVSVMSKGILSSV